MRYSTPFAILLLATTFNSAAASVIVASSNSSAETVEAIGSPNFDNVHFHMGAKGLYRPSGSQPWDKYGLGRASVSMSFTGDLDTPLIPLHYEGKDSMYAEVTGYIHVTGRRDTPHNLDLPIHAAVVLSPSVEGTDLFLKAISTSGALPSRFDFSKVIGGNVRDEKGGIIFGAIFYTAGAKSTYAIDYQNVADQGTLRVLTEVASTQLISSRALAITRVIAGSQTYLATGPGDRRPLSLWFTSNPIPEPSTFSLAAMAGLSLVGRRHPKA